MTNLITLLDAAIFLLPILAGMGFIALTTYRSLSVRFA
jgi:hypothetical protein